MNTPALPSRMRTLRLRATMPGRLGKPAALLAAIVLFLAALPILTMITMSFSASDTLEFPPSSYSLQWYRAAWHSFVAPDAATRCRWAVRSPPA